MNFFSLLGVEEFNTDIGMKPNQDRNILNFQHIGLGGQYEHSIWKLIKLEGKIFLLSGLLGKFYIYNL